MTAAWQLLATDFAVIALQVGSIDPSYDEGDE